MDHTQRHISRKVKTRSTIYESSFTKKSEKVRQYYQIYPEIYSQNVDKENPVTLKNVSMPELTNTVNDRVAR